jgi:hypothetical protein
VEQALAGDYAEMCACGDYWPCSAAAAPGSSYDTGTAACVAVHAEANALLFARASVKGAVLYCTDEPCDGCLRLIQGAGIGRIVTRARLMAAQGDVRDPEFTRRNQNRSPVDDPPVCERKLCGHLIGCHQYDPATQTHGPCADRCGCPSVLYPEPRPRRV